MDTRASGALPEGYLFEITGGNPALDLANTFENRPTERARDLLGSYADLVTWSEQSGLVDAEAGRRLRAAASRRPAAAEAVLRRARALREAVFAVFSALAAGESPPEAALATLNAALPPALSRLRVSRAGEGFGWAFEQPEDALDPMLPPLARAAAELLVSERRLRVRECAAGTCSWLFLDESRNASRRWCDMTVCGNRDKARRHYRRVQQARRKGERAGPGVARPSRRDSR